MTYKEFCLSVAVQPVWKHKDSTQDARELLNTIRAMACLVIKENSPNDYRQLPMPAEPQHVEPPKELTTGAPEFTPHWSNDL